MKKALAAAGLLVLILGGGFYVYTGYLIHQHRNAVLAQLKDPDSAKFRNERLLNREGLTVDGTTLCGEVNAKNEMGGYAGYKQFASASSKHAEVATTDIDLIAVSAYCE